MLLKTQSDLYEYVENLQLNGRRFKIIQSSSKVQVIKGDLKCTYFPNEFKSKKGMYFIKKVKEYVIKNNINFNFDLKVDYNKMNKKTALNKWYKSDVYEIDLKAAYWYFFKQNGFCNDDLFNEGLTVDKKVRLMEIGRAHV